MPDKKIKITKGAPSHTLGERLKFEVINLYQRMTDIIYGTFLGIAIKKNDGYL